MVDEKYSNYTKRIKERLMDYFEAMEEVLPALHDLHDHIILLSKYEGKQLTYEQQIAYRTLFASLKSES